MKICVFGASSNQIDQKFLEAGETLGKLIGEHGHTLVFGGGCTGMMGAAARGAASCQGKMIGVAPSFFDRPGVLYSQCTEFVYTDTMRERKDYMEQISDAFIVTAGGIGTYEEFFEVFTLKQLGQLDKPIVLLNTEGYYDAMMELLEMTVKKGFLAESVFNQLRICDTPEKAISMLERKVHQLSDCE